MRTFSAIIIQVDFMRRNYFAIEEIIKDASIDVLKKKTAKGCLFSFFAASVPHMTYEAVYISLIATGQSTSIINAYQ